VSGRSDWGGYVEPAYVPGPSEAYVFFGANPCHAPERERQADRPDGTCPQCGADDTLSDPTVPVHEGSPVVCVKCQRWGRDRKLADLMLADAISRGTIEPVLALSEPEMPEAARRELIAEWVAHAERRPEDS
jgi:hypothetical protein